MGYVHVEAIISQESKKIGKPCGDVVIVNRSKNSTDIIVCDGLGSGINANIFAVMCASRLKELLSCGFSLRKAFKSLAKTMSEAPQKDLPYSAFSIARILSNGVASVLSFDMPPPIIISSRYASLPKQSIHVRGVSVIAEANFTLSPYESILLISDGIAQAGIGKGLSEGLKIEGVIDHINAILPRGVSIKDLPELVRLKAKELWLGKPEDDSTAVLASCRKGAVVNIFTGAPSLPEKDDLIVKKFINQEGYKIICGGTTSKIVSRHLNAPLEIKESYKDSISPPAYAIKGINLVTEGAVSLNQLYNILDANPYMLDKKNPVSELFYFLKTADRINFTVGLSVNPASSDISFVQQRILPRRKIIPLIADKLREEGKLVVIEYV